MGMWLRRVAVATVAVFGLTVAVPAGAVPSGGSFPLSWLTSWQRPAWASGAPRGQRPALARISTPISTVNKQT